MNISRNLQKRRESGIALIIVMIVIVVLATLAAGFAYSMKVETKLARNSTFEADMELLGRSGVELGRYVLGLQLGIPQEGSYAALNQKWAGGHGGTNELLMDIHLENNQLGQGTFNVRIIDMERKFNLAMVREGNTIILESAMEKLGVDVTDQPVIIDSYLDWVDPDEQEHMNGAESKFYLRNNPASPYYSKNGPLDDVSELLLIKGVSPELYWGSQRTGITFGQNARRGPRANTAFLQGNTSSAASGAGLVDLFTAISGAGLAVNVNTASREVLNIIPGMDHGMADAIINTRSGPDHMDGTEDDTPFMTPGELPSAVPGMDPAIFVASSRYFTTQSYIFEITVDAAIGEFKRQFVALVHRRGRQDVAILYFHWK
ncbi:MAG: general secretion pathway protein GspK [Verrucomicrobiales bacterium]